MASNDIDGRCPCCRKLLPDEIMLVTCMLNSDCCAACVARCMAVDRCGLIDDKGFWDALDALISRANEQRIIPGKRV